MSALSNLKPESKGHEAASAVRNFSQQTAPGPLALVAHRGSWAHTDGQSGLLSPPGGSAIVAQGDDGLPANPERVVGALGDRGPTRRESLRWAGNRLSKTGAQLGDDSLEVFGHRAASACHYWLGEFTAARREGDQAQRLYDPQRHWDLAALTNTDPFTGEGIYRVQFLWMMGYPDQARAASLAMEANARRRGHPFDLAFALTLGAQLFDYLCEFDALLQRTEGKAEHISSERGIPFAWRDHGRNQPRRGIASRRTIGRRVDTTRSRHRSIDEDGTSYLDLVSQQPASGGAGSLQETSSEPGY